MNGGDGPMSDDMAFWVYVLRCSDQSYYTGHTDNIDKRLNDHHGGLVEG